MKKSLLMLALQCAFLVPRRPVADSNRCWYCGELIHPLDTEHPARCANAARKEQK